MPSQHWNPRPWLMEESHAHMVTLSSGLWTVWGGCYLWGPQGQDALPPLSPQPSFLALIMRTPFPSLVEAFSQGTAVFLCPPT